MEYKLEENRKDLTERRLLELAFNLIEQGYKDEVENVLLLYVHWIKAKIMDDEDVSELKIFKQMLELPILFCFHNFGIWEDEL